MFATYWNSLDEATSRRVAYVIFGLALLVAVVFNMIVHTRRLPNSGPLVVAVGSLSFDAPAFAVPAVLNAELRATGSLWFMLVIFAAAPLLTAGLEKGWLDLTFSKGTPRWKIFLGRFLAGVTLYSLTVLVSTAPLAIRLWWVTGIPTWQLGIALLIQSLSFAAVFSLCALAALPQKGVALPIVGAVGLVILSTPLAHRQEIFFQLISSKTVHIALDWAYRILPKCSELENVGAALFQTGHLAASVWWWPVWSTAAFALGTLGLSLWILQRKSF
jgi:ABC-type transport system involved in multi-copper enzyme maturation permease subunit